MPLGGAVTLGAIGAATGAAQLISGAHNLKKDKAELANLKRPFYRVQDEYFQNRNLAAEMASGGMPADTKNYLTTETQRGLGTGLSAIMQGGGGPNDVAKLFDVYQRGIDRTAAEDADLHLKNIQYYMEANKDIAGQKNIQWSLNEKQPYEAKLKELTERQAADKANIWGGVNTIAGSATSVITGMNSQALMGKLFAGNGVKTDPFESTMKQASIPGIAQLPGTAINTSLALPM